MSGRGRGCHARRPNGQVLGYFSPLISEKLLKSRIGKGLMQVSETGLEKRCSRCRQFWPFDTEFWFVHHAEKDGLFQWCKACTREAKAVPGHHALTQGAPELRA